jgi:hypothetical protein
MKAINYIYLISILISLSSCVTSKDISYDDDVYGDIKPIFLVGNESSDDYFENEDYYNENYIVKDNKENNISNNIYNHNNYDIHCGCNTNWSFYYTYNNGLCNNNWNNYYGQNSFYVNGINLGYMNPYSVFNNFSVGLSTIVDVNLPNIYNGHNSGGMSSNTTNGSHVGNSSSEIYNLTRTKVKGIDYVSPRTKSSYSKEVYKRPITKPSTNSYNSYNSSQSVVKTSAWSNKPNYTTTNNRNNNNYSTNYSNSYNKPNYSGSSNYNSSSSRTGSYNSTQPSKTTTPIGGMSRSNSGSSGGYSGGSKGSIRGGR